LLNSSGDAVAAGARGISGHHPGRPPFAAPVPLLPPSPPPSVPPQPPALLATTADRCDMTTAFRVRVRVVLPVMSYKLTTVEVASLDASPVLPSCSKTNEHRLKRSGRRVFLASRMPGGRFITSWQSHGADSNVTAVVVALHWKAIQLPSCLVQ
jgi:hypothetical protein